MKISVPGTYNEWSVGDPSVQAEEEGKGRFVYTRRLPRGVHRFKFAADASWTRNWGSNGRGSIVAPCQGEAQEGGNDLLLNAVDSGTYTFTFDVSHQRWSVEAAPDTGGLAAALSHLSSQGRLKSLLTALAATNGAGPSAPVVDSLQSLLFADRGQSGILPLRGDGKVLFAYPAQPHESVQVAASWRGWGDHLLNLHHLPGTALHLQLTEVPQGVHPYKVIYNGGWMADIFNPWVAPDRISVPKFQLGNFNSLLCLNVSPVETGEAFLHRPDFHSAMMGNSREIWVWLPPSYMREPQRRYRTLYFLDGNEVITRTFPHDVLRAAVADGDAEEAIMVFVSFASQNERIHEFADPIGRDRFAQFFVRELVPYVDVQFRTQTEAAARGITGVSLGGNFAYYLARTWPDVFGNAAGQGTSWSWSNWEILRLYENKPKAALRLYMDGAREAWEGGPEDSGEATRKAAETLRNLGYSVTHVEHVNEEHDWPSWKGRMPRLIRWFAGIRKPAKRARPLAKV